MTPLQRRGFFLWSGTATIMVGDALRVLRRLPDRHYHCCISSPPYFGLRDYGTGRWEGGDPACDHARPIMPQRDRPSAENSTRGQSPWSAGANKVQYGRNCPKCGAHRVDLQVGLEDTPEEYVQRLVEIMREVRRVLRDDGTIWLVLGDSYVSAPAGNKTPSGISQTSRKRLQGGLEAYNTRRRLPTSGLKPKDLIGIPWMVAFALRADGWYLRNDIIWHKPNPMPESITDRCTSSHEYVFLLSKSPRYFYDYVAVQEPALYAGSVGHAFGATGGKMASSSLMDHPKQNLSGQPWSGDTRNLRDVWTIATEPVPEAHFATYPQRLVERCVKAATSEHGCCPSCGTPYERMVEKEVVHHAKWFGPKSKANRNQHDHYDEPIAYHTVGWSQSCKCQVAQPTPCRVLDMFGGTGTTGLVAGLLARHSTLIELNEEYAQMARKRIAGADVPAEVVVALRRRLSDGGG